MTATVIANNIGYAIGFILGIALLLTPLWISLKNNNKGKEDKVHLNIDQSNCKNQENKTQPSKQINNNSCDIEKYSLARIRNINELAIERGNIIKINNISGNRKIGPEGARDSSYEYAKFLYINGCNTTDELLIKHMFVAGTDLLDLLEDNDPLAFVEYDEVMAVLNALEVNEIVVSYINYNNNSCESDHELKLYLSREPYSLSAQDADRVVSMIRNSLNVLSILNLKDSYHDAQTKPSALTRVFLDTYLYLDISIRLNEEEYDNIINAANMLLHPKNGHMWLHSDTSGAQRRLIDAMVLTDAGIQDKHMYIVFMIYRTYLLYIFSTYMFPSKHVRYSI